MPFKFSRGPEPPGHDEVGAYPDEQVSALVRAAPRLSTLHGRWVKFGGLADLVRDGWAPDDVARLVASWPDLGRLDLSLLIQLAVSVRRRVGGDIAHVIAWTRALATDEAPGRFRPRELATTELQSARQATAASLPELAERYAVAAGSPNLGLAGLSAGLSVNETRDRNDRGTLDAAELRAVAASRGLYLP